MSDQKMGDQDSNSGMKNDAVPFKRPAKEAITNEGKSEAEHVDSGELITIVQNRTDEEYSMANNPRGKAIILNHFLYEDKELPARKGTDKDRNRIKNVLELLGFQTEVYEDQKFSQIKEILEKVSKEDHGKYDCLIIVVMSHGEMLKVENEDEEFENLIRILANDPEQRYKKEELQKKLWEALVSQRGAKNKQGKLEKLSRELAKDGRYTKDELQNLMNSQEENSEEEKKIGKLTQIHAYDQPYNEEELWKPFSEGQCHQSLLGKPKLFFIQACRGVEDEVEKNKGTWVAASKSQREGSQDLQKNVPKFDFYAIPDVADLLITRATFEEWVAYRHGKDGSPFIQTLCKEFEEDAKKDNTKKYDLHRLLTNVNRKVAFDYMLDTTDEATAKKIKITTKKQMPNFYSTLTRLVYFKNLKKSDPK